MRFRPTALFILPLIASAQTPSASGRVVRPFLSLGFTAGGDTLATVTYSDGSTSSIKAGGETLFRGGLDVQLNPKFSLQASYGLHTDSTKDANNGSLDFKRNAIEGDAFWHPTGHQRLGLGFRKASDARVTGNGAASIPSLHFDASTGTVLQWEYLSGPLTSFGSRAGFSIRYVNEKYSLSSIDGFGSVSGAPSVDGSHFGLVGTWYF